MLIGQEGIEILASSTVSVFGLGGVGSFTVEALVRAGLGSLVLTDFDTVSPSNLNRQLHAMEDTVGMSKVDLMTERIRRINSRVDVTGYRCRYTPEDRDRFFAVRPDYVVDAIDDVDGKVDLIKYCLMEGIPVVSSMGAGNKMDPALFRLDDISKTSVCPLAREVRRRLRKEGITSGLKVVFSTEQPCTPKRNNDVRPEKVVPASISFVPPVAGMILAGAVVRDLISWGGSV
ncbi:MAG: tRNA threonylcarbamoyladenosine dehydratase [Bacillota bacterium]